MNDGSAFLTGLLLAMNIPATIPWYIPVVAGVIILVGMVASIIPIILGARRNPITDMRDDS